MLPLCIDIFYLDLKIELFLDISDTDLLGLYQEPTLILWQLFVNMHNQIYKTSFIVNMHNHENDGLNNRDIKQQIFQNNHHVITDNRNNFIIDVSPTKMDCYDKLIYQFGNCFVLFFVK